MNSRFTPTEVTLKELSNSEFKELVAEDLTFVDAHGAEWTAPVGTWTDGASVPRVALWITDGRFNRSFLKAAVVHDAYCQKENKNRRPPYQSKPWRDVHRMFHQACLVGGTSDVLANVMFAAVRWFGPRWNDPEGEAQQVEPDRAYMGFSGTKQWIEEAQPSVEEIEANVVRRERELMEISNSQYEAIAAMKERDFAMAEAKLEEADVSIAAGLERSPDDLMLLNLRGYPHKNWALLIPDRKQVELNNAEQIFNRVIAVDPRDPSALNGLGSVAILRERLDEAEQLIRKALEQVPDYGAALHDLILVQRIRAFRSSQE